MGVIFSSSPYASKENILRLPINIVEKAVSTYCSFQLPPLLDHNGYKFFMMLALEDMKDNSLAIQTSQTYYEIFSHQASCSSQEVLTCMIWLCNGTWNQKFGLLFDVFKSLGSDDMGRDDLILATDIVITALSRLWVYETKRTDSEESNYERMKRVTEDIADRALLKMDKEMEDMVQRADFIKWGVLRFIGSEHRGNKNTSELELKSAFDVEYTLMNQLLFLDSDGEEDEGKYGECSKTGASSNQEEDDDEVV